MGQNQSVTLLIVLALLAANWPFLTKRLFGIWRLQTEKSLAVRLLELALLYCVMGLLGLFLEQRLGQAAPQKWEFYALTVTCFMTFAFPGFVWRYLLKRR